MAEKINPKSNGSDRSDMKDASSELYQEGTVEPANTDAVIRENFKQTYPAPVVWFLERLFATGAEARGVERVLETERRKSGGWDQLLFWFSVCLSSLQKLWAWISY